MKLTRMIKAMFISEKLEPQNTQLLFEVKHKVAAVYDLHWLALTNICVMFQTNELIFK